MDDEKACASCGRRRRVEITQRGRVVDPSTAKGAIRIRAVR